MRRYEKGGGGTGKIMVNRKGGTKAGEPYEVKEIIILAPERGAQRERWRSLRNAETVRSA
jgi:hypothetical protein